VALRHDKFIIERKGKPIVSPRGTPAILGRRAFDASRPRDKSFCHKGSLL
jgi:hypothetical protein